ncbi:probable polyamine oxidase 5 isoform X2 [Phalaenopsis equestris]|uniref:probable polyamine oxidase 5 isoform X1 n=1 Tax=Phalaenopsis equestris TaxID=78828 RepID=UPI0009E2BF0D|nr:probable polyamine oxidase 5 isoform X1 [Phalaenopsis equestris]XP_020583724.1 probable polyamine oxidase 5 isoform X2 [Phalaenopsis equestris]
MGEVDCKKPKVVIVGAGMAGLAAARRLHVCAGDFLDLVVVEAGDRIGGRILTSEFSGACVEMGATWIHGIERSPVYEIARKAGALIPDRREKDGESFFPWERMDGFPSDTLTIAEGGQVMDPSLLRRISALFSDLKSLIVSGETAADTEIVSVGAFLRNGFDLYRAANGGDWMEEAAFAMHECGEREYTAVDDLCSLDLAAEEEYMEFPGEHITLPGGYSRVPEFLAAALPRGTIRLGRGVSRVEWCLSGRHRVRLHFDDGEVEHADHAIITVSLGVLKAGIKGAGGLLFSPSLPEAKRGAIDRLGFGLVNKLFMEVEGGINKVKSPFPFLRMAFDPGRHMSEIPWWMRRTDSICPIHGGSNVLLAWFVGREAAEIEKMEEDEIIHGVHATLAGFSPESTAGGEFGRISKVRSSGWGRNPRFLGSYSYVAVGSSGDDQDALADPVDGSLQLLFAGEATHRTRYATTHGAYLSGVREADRLARYYGFESCGG